MDTVDRATRSRIMRAIKGRNTTPERRLAAELRKSGASLTRHAGYLPGTPDIVAWSPDGCVAVFVHGCFWHGCARHYRCPKTRRAFWRAKVADNKRRDSRVRRRLNALGYRTMVVWEHEDPMSAASRIVRRL